MTNDVQKILYGGNKSEAIKSLTGTLAETITFNAVKIYIIAALTTAGARGIASMFGMWGDDDDKNAENKADLNINFGGEDVNVSANTKKLIANAASGFFFSGMGSMTQGKINEGMNALYKMTAVESFKDGTVNKFPSLFYSRSATDESPDYSGYGLYGILASKIAGMEKSAEYSVTGKYQGVNSFRQDEEKTLTPEERSLYTMSFILDALGGVQDKLMEKNVVPL